MMEFSSPLAAMAPPPVPSWCGGRRDLPGSRLMYSGAHTLAPSSFNFRDMSMQKQTQSQSHDYFSMKPPRGSSPTMSLAADLSSNFHIDQSPQIPTPRRSLFARDLFLPYQDQGLLVTPPVENEGATTPPIPSSSPAMDCMDISPLPHKAPCFVARVTLPSSPQATPEEEDEQMLTPGRDEQSLSALSLAPLPALTMPTQARKFNMPRPSLTKSKMHSTTSIPTHTGKDILLPAFQFGSLGSAPTTCLPETLMESPIEESTPSATAVRRPSLTNLSRANGSPMGGVTRKSSIAPQRPRKQVRRSHSMFQHPNDVMKESDDFEPPVPTLASMVDVDAPYKHRLPHFLPDEPESLPRIQQDTLINVLEGQYSAHYDRVLVVDARFEYEYQGGHIEGAVNHTNRELLAKELFDREGSSRTLLIFHCEYSQHRAPLMAKFVRNHDRMVNAHRYPQLTYPEIYILDGGYSQFFKQYRTKCFPQAYVEMEHKDHEKACEKGMGKLKQRAKLSRAQTFAFGQSCSLEDSPTSGFGVNRSYSSMEVNDVSPMIARSFASRLVTY